MNILSADSVSKSFSERWLFKNISFGISHGEKIAIVGINGSGKTTLLNTISGIITPDEGSVSIRKGTTIGYLGQNPVFNEEASVWQTIFQTNNELLNAIKEYEYALLHIEEKPDLLGAAAEKMDSLNAWDFEAKIKQILSKLDITDFERPVKFLSGGQRKRVALAKLLLDEPDLMILDEPTNHLDLPTIEWLEALLATKNQTLILVTHDRYFLDRITNIIFELENSSLYRYNGNYSYFLEKKAERVLIQDAEVDKARNLMRKELDWIRRQPKARGTKAKYRVDAFEDIKEKASQKRTESKIELNVGMARTGKKIMEMKDVYKGYGDLQLIKDFSYTFKKQDRIGIIGKNGIGKSTFLDILTGKIQPDKGIIDKGENTLMGYYTQSELRLPEDKRIIEVVKDIAEVMETGSGEVITASQLLTHFQFPPKTQYTYVSKLSGGEKRRLQLLQILIKNPNFLILDEPTNDLDIMTLNILEDFLFNYGGCLMLVSHDRYFMDRLVDHLFIFEGEGIISDFAGNYSDYREYLQEQEDDEAQKKKMVVEKPVAKPAVTQNKVKLSFKEKQEYDKLEGEIANLETKKATLVEKLNVGKGTHTEILEWSREVEKLTKEVEVKTDRWLELGEFEG